MHYIGERQHRQRGGGGKGRGAASEKSISVAGATAVAATDSVASRRQPKEWLAGWLAGWRTGLLHARHASFVPQADCAFSSIGLTHRSTEGRIGAALCYRWTNYLLAERGRERLFRALSSRSVAHASRWRARGGRGRAGGCGGRGGSFDSCVGLTLGIKPD